MINDETIKEESVNPRTDLKSYPKDFRELFTLVQPEPDCFESAEKNIRKNKFFKWLNKDGSSFSKAKEKMISKKLIPPKDFLPKSEADFADKYALEYICTCIVHYFCEREDILRQVPALKEQHGKIRTAMARIHEQLAILGTAPFEQNVMQHIFQASLDALLRSDAISVFSSAKIHEYLVRELVTKRAIESLFMRYLGARVTDSFIRQRALDIVDQFFHSRPTSGLVELTAKIKEKAIEQRRLLADDMTISKFIFEQLHQ